MHETTQRRVCRTAFVVGCVLPTLCTIAWIAFLHRPWRENDWQRMLQQRLHVRATVDEIRSPRPGVTQLLGVRFADLRTERPWGSIDELRVEGWKSLLVADRIEISAAQLPDFSAAVATWISSFEMPAIPLRAERLVLVGAAGESFELKNVRLQSLAHRDAHKQIELQAEPLDAEPGETIKLVIEHHAGQAAPIVFARLDTQKGRLPAWLLADWVPGLKRCAGAQFAGRLQTESHSRQLHGNLSGQLEAVDLEKWFGRKGSAQMQGTARLQLDLRWQNRRLETTQGSLRAGVGRVSPSLLAALSKKHYFPLGEQLAGADLADIPGKISPGPMISFDQLACDFKISSEGIAISGKCETAKSSEAGALLAVEGRALLLQPRYRVLQVARLVQVFTPRQAEASWLPATLEANQMARGLPLPHAEGRKK